MTEPTTPVQDAVNETVTEPTTEELANKDIKEHPVFLSVTKQLAEYKAKEAERAAAEESARREAEENRLKEQGQFEEYKTLQEKRLQELQDKHAKDILERDLKLELSNTGFKNEKFVKGAIADYNPEAGTIQDFVKSLAEDEANKPFLSTGQRQPLVPPSSSHITSASVLSVQEIKKLQASPDGKDNLKAAEYLGKYYDTHGTFPDGI